MSEVWLAAGTPDRVGSDTRRILWLLFRACVGGESMTESHRYKVLHELSPIQATALGLLDTGVSHAEAALAAGVDRTTVSRWATRHPAFIAELNRRKEERAEEGKRPRR